MKKAVGLSSIYIYISGKKLILENYFGNVLNLNIGTFKRYGLSKLQALLDLSELCYYIPFKIN